MLKAPRRGVPFRLYVAAEDKVIGAVLTQETEDKEYVITYISRRLIDAGSRSMRGQIIADFIVEHRINDNHDLKVGYVTVGIWGRKTKIFYPITRNYCCYRSRDYH